MVKMYCSAMKGLLCLELDGQSMPAPCRPYPDGAKHPFRVVDSRRKVKRASPCESYLDSTAEVATQDRFLEYWSSSFLEIKIMHAEHRQTVLQLYAEVDREIAAAGPVCVASGRCCRFKEYGHTLFLSHLEAEVLLADAPEFDPGSVTADFCPFQKGNLCTARESRPLGCRIYYCDPNYQQTAQDLSEKYLRRLKQLASDNDLGWRYAPLHLFLRESSKATS